MAVTTRRSARKPKGDGHLRRAEILEAAERIFVAEGYEGATIRKIADEVGVSSTALYMHFPDKSCILLEICQGTIRQLLERNAEIAAKPMDATNRVKLMLDAYMRWGLAHPNAYELVFCNAARLIAVIGEEPTTADLGDQCYQVFSGVVREIAADGRLRTGTADSAAQALWTSCHGLVSMMIARPKFEWAPTDELIQVTLEGLMHGLVAD
nr:MULTISPECIES: TetR/AcrR family transcriptional regulator [unclassified Phenylobacterium]